VEEQRRHGTWVRYWPLLAPAIVGLMLGCVLAFPRLLYPPLSTTELQARGVRDPREQVQLQNDRLKLQNDARTTLLQALGGLLVASTAGAGAYTAWRQLQDNRRQQQRNEELSREQLQLSREQLRQALDTNLEELRLTRESQITEQFTRAIEQLGNDKVEVCLGGVYALERIAKNFEMDRATVTEVLTEFVRSHAPWVTRSPGAEDSHPTPTVDEHIQWLQDRAPDVQTAMTVLGRRGDRPGDTAVHLGRVDLRRSFLPAARLSGAWIRDANLARAHMPRINLDDAHLDNTDLRHALLENASLRGAGLEGADLRGAHLEGANLSGASLVGANLSGAWLGGANLSRARLLRVNLSGARLQGSDLTGALELTQAQLDAAHGDAATRLPDGLQRPDSWPAKDAPAQASP
jgi:hypothetical protein